MSLNRLDKIVDAATFRQDDIGATVTFYLHEVGPKTGLSCINAALPEPLAKLCMVVINSVLSLSVIFTLIGYLLARLVPT